MNARGRKKASRSRFVLVPLLLAVVIVVVGGWQGRALIGELWQPGSPQQLVTAADVNLRSGPGTGYDVLRVIPAGVAVDRAGASVDAFTPVIVEGERGWISQEWLAAPGAGSETLAYAPAVSAAEVQVSDPAPTAVPTQAPTSEPTAAPAAVPTAAPTEAPVYQPVEAGSNQVEHEPQPGERWIEVNRTTRTVTLHNGEIIVAQFDALIGKDPSPDGYYSTAVGTYHVWVMEPALAETPFAEGVYLTHFVGFDPDRSNGFHSPTRDSQGNIVYTGGQQTLGCVRLSEHDAITLFEFAHIGMRVEVHD